MCFGIQVGVSINLLIKRGGKSKNVSSLTMLYANVSRSSGGRNKSIAISDEKEQYSNIDWVSIDPG